MDEKHYPNSLPHPTELLGTCWLVFFGCGAMAGGANTQLAAAFAWAASYMAVHYLYGSDSNPAVTIAHILNGDMGAVQGLIDIVAQGAGAVAGSALLLLMVHNTAIEAHTGTNKVSGAFHNENAFIGEALITFFVVTAIMEIKSNANCSPLAVGLAYFLAHLVLFPIDGCSVNPARSFAPAVIGSFHSHDDSVTDVDKMWTDHWVFWIGPIAGAIIAAMWRKMTGDSSADQADPEGVTKADQVEDQLEKVA